MNENEMKKPEQDRQPLPEKINVAMPANIRFGFYPSRD
jgi:hypothetical protein